MSALRKPSTALEEALARTPWEHHVLWTGAPGGFRRGSLVSRCLSLVDVAGQPVRLRWLIQRAAEVDPVVADAPLSVRDALRLHQKAKPAVYLLLDRGACGTFYAVADVAYAGVVGRRLQAGEAVIDSQGRPVVQLDGPPPSGGRTAAGLRAPVRGMMFAR